MNKKLSIAILAAAMLAGCSTAVPVKDDNPDSTAPAAEVERFNMIQNLVKKGSTAEAFDEMFKDTLAAYNSRIEIDAESQGTFVYAELDDGKTDLEDESANRDSDTVTFVQNGNLYIITDHASGLLNITRYGKDGGKILNVVKVKSGEFVLKNVGGKVKDSISNDERQQSILADFFKMNISIPFNPIDNPEYYEFETSETGTGCVISIDVKNEKSFNEAVAKAYNHEFELDGHRIDKIQILKNYFDVEINNEGVIQQITNVVEINFKAGSETKMEKYAINTSIYSYDYKSFNTDAVDKLFAGVDDGSIKPGQEVSLK